MTSSRPVFALADVNSMYCSCERVFRPDLRYTPLVALSNNDDCVIAQTAEIKALDIEMAQPWYQVKEKALAHGVIAFSSNYELHADFSNRFNEVLRRFTPRLEVYSIDECFLDLTGINRDLTEYGREIKDTVLQWVKLPICVGMGHSKTLAKLANKVAKKQERFGGVCDFTAMDEAELDRLLESIDVEKVWGVGRRLTAKLADVGVKNVLRLKRADPKRVRDKFGVLLERTVRELNGEVWIEMLDGPPPSKQVMSSRSFGDRVTTLHELEAAISFHATNAAFKLRKQALYAKTVFCFIQNSPFDKHPYYNSRVVALPAPTDITMNIAQAALGMLKQMYKTGVYYQKVGVMLSDLVPAEGQQTDLFGYTADRQKASALMESLDKINKKYGRGTTRLASEGFKNAWAMQRNLKSPNYTTDWDELPVIGKKLSEGNRAKT
jgi:DNA polymerase V